MGWNTQFKKNVKKFDIKNIDLCLEIGCYRGHTSNYIVENILSTAGKLICVDPLEDTYLVDNLTPVDIKNNVKWKNFKGQYDQFIFNTKENLENNKIELIRKTSTQTYPLLKYNYLNSFNLIYIDGDHREMPVYLDGVNCFNLLKTDGIMIFDDYDWKDYSNQTVTKYGIDKFLNEYKDKLKILTIEYQVVIQKII